MGQMYSLPKSAPSKTSHKELLFYTHAKLNDSTLLSKQFYAFDAYFPLLELKQS